MTKTVTGSAIGGSQSPSARDEDRRMVLALRLSAISTAVATYLLVILGSTVRVTESGMGCRGWPLCDGALGPRVDHFHSLMEQSHRYLVVLVTIGVIVTAVIAWRMRKRVPAVVVPAFVGAGVIVVQIVLGAITVWTKNAPVTVALHLLVAMIFLAVAVVAAVASVVGSRSEAIAGNGRLGRLGWITLAGTFVLMISGSMVVDGGAAKACPSWPLCTSSHAAFPLVVIQMTHRLVVGCVSVAIIVFSVHVMRRWRGIRAARAVAHSILGTLLIQVGVGGVDAVLKAPAAIQDVHLALAGAIWVGVVCLASLGWYYAADSGSSVDADGPGDRLPSSPRQTALH
ncbi:MAG: COX15/CtaA family protein [Acidimicrobiales bacterium]